MNNNNLLWLGRHEGWLRYIAHGVKDGDEQCIERAAKLFDIMLPDECIIVPMPSHVGYATTMTSVCLEIASKSDRAYLNILRCAEHESSYSVKHDGMEPEDYEMWLAIADGWRPCMPVFILDNVICTGVTATSAIRAFKSKGIDARVLALTRSTWRS
jgi:predicted amidophosphoribosyltransferase